jgi:hypothetical protein
VSLDFDHKDREASSQRQQGYKRNLGPMNAVSERNVKGGSFGHLTKVDGDIIWQFSQPTMIDYDIAHSFVRTSVSTCVIDRIL